MSSPHRSRRRCRRTRGASARREYERRRDRRAERVRGRYGALGGLVLWLTPEPRSERNWAAGAVGESKLAAKLERWTARGGDPVARPSRPGHARDHRPHRDRAGAHHRDRRKALLRPDPAAASRRAVLPSKEHLVVAGRDRTKLVDAVERQVQVVHAALDAADDEVPVVGVLCFVDGQWPFFGSIKVREVPVVPPHALARLCTASGRLESERLIDLAERLAARLPPA